MRRLVGADKLMDGLGRLAIDTDLCKRYGNCTPWIPYSAVRKLISDMILEAKESCDDAVSRQGAIDKIKKRLFEAAFNNVGFKQDVDKTLADVAENRLEIWFNELPPIQPERKTGHWVETGDEPYDEWECDVCGFAIDGSGCIDPEEYRDVYKFCPNCGADMRGKQDGR